MTNFRCAFKTRARALILGLGLSLTLASCGPKPPERTPAPPAGGETATVTPQATATTAPDGPAPATGSPTPATGGPAPAAGSPTPATGGPAPAAGGPVPGSPLPGSNPTQTDPPVPPGAPIVRQAREHWAEVDLSSLPKRARRILNARSPGGYLELQSSQGVKKVEVGEILSLGLEADLSFLLGGPVKVDGQTMEITYVVTLDDEKREHIDTVILDEARSRIPYTWSEEKGVWVAGAPLPAGPPAGGPPPAGPR